MFWYDYSLKIQITFKNYETQKNYNHEYAYWRNDSVIDGPLECDGHKIQSGLANAYLRRFI